MGAPEKLHRSGRQQEAEGNRESFTAAFQAERRSGKRQQEDDDRKDRQGSCVGS